MKMIDRELYPEKSGHFTKKSIRKKKNLTPISLNKTEGASLYNDYVIRYESQRKFMIDKIVEAIISEIKYQMPSGFLLNPMNLVFKIQVQYIFVYFSNHNYIINDRLKKNCINIKDAELMPTCDKDIYEFVYKNFKDIEKICRDQSIYIKKKFQNETENKEADVLIECRLTKKRFNIPKIHFKVNTDKTFMILSSTVIISFVASIVILAITS